MSKRRLEVNNYNSFIHYSPDLETSQMSTEDSKDVQSQNEIIVGSTTRGTTDTTMRINLKCSLLSVGESRLCLFNKIKIHTGDYDRMTPSSRLAWATCETCFKRKEKQSNGCCL